MRSREQFRMKVWREPNWPDDSDMLWRAQVYDARGQVASLVGRGPTREAAIADCVASCRPPHDNAEWISMDEARQITASP